MTVADIIKLSEKINIFNSLVKNYISKDENIEKPQFVIKNVTNSDIVLTQGSITDAIILAVNSELEDDRAKYNYIQKTIKEEFKLDLDELIEKYAVDEYINSFKTGLNESREKENGASLSFTIIEDDESNKPQVNNCTIKLKDIFEKNETYFVIEDLVGNYAKKNASPHYIQAITWLKKQDLDTMIISAEE